MTHRSARWTTLCQTLICIGIFGATIIDLWVVSRLVTYTTMVDDPPIAHIEESRIRQLLGASDQPPRVLAPGANLPNVLGVSSLPVYLTFGPREYVDPKLSMPTNDPTGQLAWLRGAGVTHVLQSHGFHPSWPRPVRTVWEGNDPVMNPAWGQFQTSIYLFALEGGRGRASWVEADAEATAQVTAYRANQVSMEANSATGGLLVLADLMYPGWNVSVDGTPGQAVRVEGWLRGVRVPPGAHRVVWTYAPRSLYWGAGVSLAACLILAAAAHVRFWRGRRRRSHNEELPR